MTESISDAHSFERMVSGQWYLPGGPEQSARHARARDLSRKIHELANTDLPRAQELLRELLAPGSHAPEMLTPFQIEYGVNTTFGKDCFVNFDVTILDCGPVTIGDRTMIGPKCSLITVTHPVDDVAKRRAGWEITRAVTIGEDCWLGAGATILPGVSIGDRAVVAAGAVVTRNVPADTLVAGVPAKIVRELHV